MSTQKRHQAGAPASQGGQFAADPKAESDVALTAGEKQLRDLGVTGELHSYERWEIDAPEGAQVFTSKTGREVVVGVEDGQVKAYIETLPDQGTTTFGRDDGDPDGVIADALHAAAAADAISSRLDSTEKYELEDVDAEVRDDGQLVTGVMIGNQRGKWTSIDYFHATAEIVVTTDGKRLFGQKAQDFLYASGAAMLSDHDWPSMFRASVTALAADEDITPDVRAAAERAVQHARANAGL